MDNSCVLGKLGITWVMGSSTKAIAAFTRNVGSRMYIILRWMYHYLNCRNSLYRAERRLSNLRNTRGLLNLKIQYKMAHDRNSNLTIYADKFLVREYVSKKIGNQYLTKLLQATNKPNLLVKTELPSEFVIKANHASGGAIIVWNSADKDDYLSLISSIDWRKQLIHPSKMDWRVAEIIMQKWLTQNYYWNMGRYPEWAYKNIDPIVLVEELLLDDQNQLPNDYKFLMINGGVR